ncbi:hypothetical protein K4H28_09805 [Deefgea tanakiae]|uniref:Uncharacterized protein n=1 Tax=Deefgea tanakiae TaxID=2865840 RepID=A0ABX8Z4A6_9NEIS|nr:hypothetical protein [Deefgea tanakiae]QZA76625.1 hypothetical protein K4H28_09805 [Deefgea tanakiae]
MHEDAHLIQQSTQYLEAQRSIKKYQIELLQPIPLAISRTALNSSDQARSQSRFHSPNFMLRIGQLMMLVGCIGMAAAIFIAYVHAGRFSLPIQVTAHLAIPISAGIFKLAYIVRLAANHALGNLTVG